MDKVIYLTQGKETTVNELDYIKHGHHKWFAIKQRGENRYYAVRKGTKLDGDRQGIRIFLHAEIMNTPADMDTDHINGDGLDNRADVNLRIITRQQNTMNKGKNKNNKSGYKGVSLHKSGSWRSEINVGGNKIYLGIFKCKHEAARVWNFAARMYHGYKYCYTNIIKEEA